MGAAWAGSLAGGVAVLTSGDAGMVVAAGAADAVGTLAVGAVLGAVVGVVVEVAGAAGAGAGGTVCLGAMSLSSRMSRIIF